MKLWNETALLSVYTLTPTHVGTGQTNGAVDLPIARDAATGFPVLPATGIKGVLRDYAALDKEKIDQLFGKDLAEHGQADGPKAGRLAFTEARLLAYPVRSLNRPFLHVTCPLILDSLRRDLRAVGGDALLTVADLPPSAAALVSDQLLANDTVVLEDLVYAANEISYSEAVAKLASDLQELIPASEAATRARFIKNLVVIPDADFGALMEYVIPVQARIKLTGGKTTDKWENPDTNKMESGSLWYEERLPSDCLFVALIGERRDRRKDKEADVTLGTLAGAKDAFSVVQIGGNETVGNGLCLTTLLHQSDRVKQP
ncbi:CRISPR-associated protein Cmr4 [Solimonas aquatica]|uniref:CRISPR-associated protein Cmr4 n=1 Tax=Solimonas aquatica TaxID=489703 RepID=A0A1H9M8I1_9GAMM|nr:type III-B CRISPR module RAMP protein Cmr4 [Solimonas aquatica]SER20090.1 CRISPR-associated protein Cmr4 [Solimonas aquatica]